MNRGDSHGYAIQAIEIKLYRDGNMICALVGEDPIDGASGFGSSVHQALRDLADKLTRDARRVEIDDNAHLTPLAVEPGSTIQTHQVELFRALGGGVCAFVGRPDGNVGTWVVGDSTHDAVRKLADELVLQGIRVEVTARPVWHMDEIEGGANRSLTNKAVWIILTCVGAGMGLFLFPYMVDAALRLLGFPGL